MVYKVWFKMSLLKKKNLPLVDRPIRLFNLVFNLGLGLSGSIFRLISQKNFILIAWKLCYCNHKQTYTRFISFCSPNWGLIQAHCELCDIISTLLTWNLFQMKDSIIMQPSKITVLAKLYGTSHSLNESVFKRECLILLYMYFIQDQKVLKY